MSIRFIGGGLGWGFRLLSEEGLCGTGLWRLDLRGIYCLISGWERDWRKNEDLGGHSEG